MSLQASCHGRALDEKGEVLQFDTSDCNTLSRKTRRGGQVAPHYPVFMNDKTARAGGSLEQTLLEADAVRIPGNGHRPLLPPLAHIGFRLRVNPLLPAGHLGQKLIRRGYRVLPDGDRLGGRGSPDLRLGGGGFYGLN